MASLRTEREVLHAGADALGGIVNGVVAEALKQSISSVPIPLVSGLAGWAVAESLKQFADRIAAARHFAKDCRELQNLLGDQSLKEVLTNLDQHADEPGNTPARVRLISLCEIISEVNLLLCKAEAASNCSNRYAAAVKQMLQAVTSHTDRRTLSGHLTKVVSFESASIISIATGNPRRSTVSSEDPVMIDATSGPPPLEAPIFQHSSILVPHIRRLLANTRNVGIVGMPGIGKTAIANDVFTLECSRQPKRFDATIWMNIGPGTPNFHLLLQRAFYELPCRRAKHPDFTDAKSGLRQMTQHVRDLNVLLVLDDVRDLVPRLGGTASYTVEALNFVAASRGSRLLVTTRQRSTLRPLSQAGQKPPDGLRQLNLIQVPSLSDQHALQLFHFHAFKCTRTATREALQREQAAQQCHRRTAVERQEAPQASHSTRRAHNVMVQAPPRKRSQTNPATPAHRSSSGSSSSRTKPAVTQHCEGNEKIPEPSPATLALMACDAKWSLKFAPQVDQCGGNPRALKDLAISIQARHDNGARSHIYSKLQKMVEEGKDLCPVAQDCENVIDGLRPSERDCFIACAAYPEEHRIPEATLLHLFATHAPLHVPESVALAKCKLQRLVDCSLLCETVSPETGNRSYFLPRILHRLALRRAHCIQRDQERKGTRCFHKMATPPGDESVRYLSLHDGRCLVDTMRPFCKKKPEGNLQACIISRAQPDSIREDFKAKKWPPKLQLLSLAFQVQDDVAVANFPGEPVRGDLMLLNSLCLAGDRAPLILLKRVLHARQLLHIDLSGCVSLKRLPECIGDCSRLLHLQLSGCTNLEEVPTELSGCKALVCLDLSMCSALKELPLSIGECSNLTHLSLSGCVELKRLPDGVSDCAKLEHIDLHDCAALACDQSTPLFRYIDSLKALTYLDLRACPLLKHLPENIKTCSKLKFLRLSACSSLEMQSEAIAQLNELVFLDISDCTNLQLPREPSSSSGLEKLTYLSLAGLDFKEIPPFLTSVPQLAHLDLSRCADLRQLPQRRPRSGRAPVPPAEPTAPGWPLLRHLNLSGCSTKLQACQGLMQLTNLDPWMLTHLDLSKCAEMSELTLAVDKLSMLAHLSLRDCLELTTLPKRLGHCSQLTHLDLSGCSKLEKLPQAATIRRHLAYLNLRGCHQCGMQPLKLEGYVGNALVHIDLSHCSNLEELPNCWDRCKQLTRLDLEGCSRVAALPPTIRKCRRLAHLNLSGCRSMVELQDCIGICTLLTEVNLSGCEQVQRLPECIGMCLQLACLDVSGCPGIKNLPRSIKHCARLQTLVLDPSTASSLLAGLPFLLRSAGGAATSVAGHTQQAYD